MQILLPPGWPRPKGYSNGVSVRGRMVFVAGMIGWDAQGEFHTDDLAGQVRQALTNVVAVLKQADALPEHIVALKLPTSASTWRPTPRSARRFANSSAASTPR